MKPTQVGLRLVMFTFDHKRAVTFHQELVLTDSLRCIEVHLSVLDISGKWEENKLIFH